MSDERYVKVTAADVSWLWEEAPFEGERREALKRLSAEFDSGRRVESIRWCTTHKSNVDADSRSCEYADGWVADGPCVVEGATLILPPEASS